jgi:hypothetical protein
MEVIGSRHGPIAAQKFTDYEKKVLGNAHKDIKNIIEGIFTLQNQN